MGISRDTRHKRRATGGKRKAYRKKRKFEMGRPPANTKIGEKRIHLVRVRGGATKYRALRLETGNFSWGSEAVSRKSRILGVVYNASNNELVRTNTLVKNCIIQIDASPFRLYYEQFYGSSIGKKRKSATKSSTSKSAKRSKDDAKSSKGAKSAKAPAKDAKSAKAPAKDAKSAKGPAKDAKSGKAPAKDAKSAKAPAKDAKKGAKAPAKDAKAAKAPAKDAKAAKAPAKVAKASKDAKDVKPKAAAPAKAAKDAKPAAAGEPAAKDAKAKEVKEKPKKSQKRIERAAKAKKAALALKKLQSERRKTAKVAENLAEQFATGRVLVCVSSRPGQSGRCDGYILEGKELDFYQRKIAQKKKAK